MRLNNIFRMPYWVCKVGSKILAFFAVSGVLCVVLSLVAGVVYLLREFMSYLDVSEGVLAVSARIFVALFVGGCVSFIYLVSKDLQKPLENKCVDYWHGDKK